MPQTYSRVAGSGNTVLLVNGQRIAFMDAFSDTPPKAVGMGAEVIQGIDDKHPVEIVTANAVGAGTLQLTLVELWDEEVWERISGYSGARTLLDVYEANLTGDEITAQRIIRQPNGDRRGAVYHGCKITNVEEAENIRKDTMTLSKNVTMMYLKRTVF